MTDLTTSLLQYFQKQCQSSNALSRIATDTRQVTSREILQQPWTWRQTTQLMVDQAEQLRKLIDAPAKPSLILAGAGTSDYIGKSVQDFLRRALKRHVDARPTTDIVLRPDEIFGENSDAVLVSFARSGNSPESVESVRIAQEYYPHIKHLVITCNREGKLARFARSQPELAHLVVLPEATNDQGLAMTSSYSSMVVAALCLAHLTQTKSLEAYAEIMGRLAEAAEKLLANCPDPLQQLADEKFDRAFYIGDGTLEGAAIESALKMQELTVGKTITRSETFLAFRHGPISAVTDRSLIIYYLSAEPHRRLYEIDLIRQLRGSATTLLVCNQCPDTLYDCVDHVIEFDPRGEFSISDSYAAPLYVIIGQLLGFFSSLAFGLQPDNPPGTSGSYSRVVQGVTIHEYGQKLGGRN